jgi:hypothetical protein
VEQTAPFVMTCKRPKLKLVIVVAVDVVDCARLFFSGGIFTKLMSRKDVARAQVDWYVALGRIWYRLLYFLKYCKQKNGHVYRI